MVKLITVSILAVVCIASVAAADVSRTFAVRTPCHPKDVPCDDDPTPEPYTPTPTPTSTPTPTPTPTPGPPEAPSNLQVGPAGANAHLHWRDNSNNEFEFRIQRRPRGATGWEPADRVPQDSVDALVPRRYSDECFQVIAVGFNGLKSQPSNEACLRDEPPGPTSTPTPTPAPVDNVPIGWLDSVTADAASGWACDQDTPSTTVAVHLYFGEPGDPRTIVVGVTANVPSEPAVAAMCGGGTAHRYTFRITTAFRSRLGRGTFPVHAYGINTNPAGSNAELWGSPKTLTVTSADRIPVGALDHVSTQAVRGWACDADTPQTAVIVHLYFGGAAGQSTIVEGVQTNRASEAVINDICGGGIAHRFRFIPSADLLSRIGPGSVPVHAYVLNSNPDGLNAELQGSPKSLQQ